MARPLTPDEAAGHKAAVLPEEVIEVFNDLIARNWNGRTATVAQEDAVQALSARLGIARDEVFGRQLLDVEPVYQAQGWQVRYDKPGWNESYGAYFEFSRA